MTGQDFQDKLDALVLDLQTVGKGQTIQVPLRNSANVTTIYPLSSDAAGVVNTAQLAAIQAVIDTLKPIATDFSTELAPVRTAGEDFTAARADHQALATAASAARTALSTALAADPAFQTAKTAVDAARSNPDYVAARTAYKDNNVSENYSNLSEARGKYI
ncbi:MAG: hypothetical protein M3367_15650 [Acidobacteriota bacterium]|nr:hypothetical protein [Acidobacteriota bacterium]